MATGTFRPVYSVQTGTDWISWSDAAHAPDRGFQMATVERDLAVTSSGLRRDCQLSVEWRWHVPSRLFSSDRKTDWASWPSAHAITGDFNGDGRADIAVTSSGLGGIASYLSNGDGTFHAVIFTKRHRLGRLAKCESDHRRFQRRWTDRYRSYSLWTCGIGSYLSNGTGTFMRFILRKPAPTGSTGPMRKASPVISTATGEQILL